MKDLLNAKSIGFRTFYIYVCASLAWQWPTVAMIVPPTVILTMMIITSFTYFYCYHYMCDGVMQADIARTFHSRLSPLRDAVDNIKTEALNTVLQHLTSVISNYRFCAN